MEFIVAIIGSFVTEAARYTISPIKNRIKYLSNLENNVQSLNEEVNQLKAKSIRIEDNVNAAKKKGDNIDSDVDDWLTAVNEKISNVEKDIQSYEQQAKKKCFAGLCPNLKARYKFSMKAEEEVKDVAKLLEKGAFDKISYPAALQDIITFTNKDFKAFESRTEVLKGIMDALKDAGISIIGVHGMGGVGKTTLVKEVARQVKESKLFDSVVFVAVTQAPDVKGIQNKIAESLDLNIDKQSIDLRACLLRERLKNEKTLVVLDDIWERLDLHEVGIPSVDPQGGLKILLTSRHLNVLSNGMETQNNFGIDLLTEDEAWDLFQKMAGSCVQSDDLQHTAIEIAKKCARLPIAIATVARALKNKSSFEWRNALRELETPSPTRFTGTITASLYSAIELSYKYLQSEEDRKTFLLCSLLGHNGSTMDLLKYTMGLGLYAGINKIDEARDKVLSVVNTLKDSCLLLDSYNDERFDIHDLVLVVALSIGFRDRGMFAPKDEFPSKEIPQDCRMMSLKHLDIGTELPVELECPHLSFFLMERVGSLKIPAGFFRQTERLKVLDLTGMHLPNLPVSIGILRNLQTLCLDGCTLEDISVVGELNNLEILSLQRSYFKALPKEIAQLTRLKLLDLRRCTKLEIIPPNILSSLSKLEELYMEDSFARWEDEIASNERRNASLEELNHLSYLTTLYVAIPKGQIIPEWLLIKNLERYRIFNGYNQVGRIERSKYSRILNFRLNTNTYPSRGMKMLVKKAEYLCLEQLEGVKNVIAELQNGKDFPHLKKLHIASGSEVQFITMEGINFSQLQYMKLKDLPQLICFCSEGNTSQQGEGTSSEPLPLFNKQSMLPRLEELELHYINVRSIWHSQLPETSSCISNLTKLNIERCDSLEHLLSPSIVRCLVQLKDFEIKRCKCLRGIISKQEMEIEEDEQRTVICFPRLASLKMDNLPNLIEFCSKNSTIEFPLLIVLKIQDCPELHEFVNSEPKMLVLFNQKVAFPSLERMTLSNMRNVKMIFHNELLEGSFCKLEEMTVENCDELLIVFPSNISFRVFQNLKKFEVRSCDSLEVIFEVKEETNVVESQLRDLKVFYARRLNQIWNRDPNGILSFENLCNVTVQGCESLKNVFPASIAKNLPQLENLSIGWCGVEEIVWEELNLEEQPLPLTLTFKFPRLSSLFLEKLMQLKCLYGGRREHTIMLEWPMLKMMRIDYSTLLKIEASQHQEVNEESQSLSHLFSFLQQVIPKLEELRLSNVKDVECGSLLQRCHSLESLQLYHCDFKDVGVVGAGTLSTITTFELRWCLNLKQLGLNFGFSASSSSSSCFQNLTTLVVHMCEMMVNLVTVSVAQNLVHLTTMKIICCIAMTEIVAKEGDEDGSTSIIFTKLKRLQLFHLPSLTSFCSENYTFNFPSLEELMVQGCPSLKLFCHGVLSTPCLYRVRDNWGGDNGHWTGELNTKIQQMYAEKVGYGELRILKLSEKFPELIEIWSGRNPQQYFNFMALEIIELCECGNLKYGFTSSIAFSLNNLWRLEVKQCINMKQVIWDECDEVEETTYNDGMFSKLKNLKIESCANLQSFYMGSGVLQFSKLETIRIFNCPKMKRFKISDTNHERHDRSGTGKMLHQRDLNIKPFFNKKVVLPSLKELEINGIRDCGKIWPKQLSLYSFCKLKKVEIESCAMLLNIFPFNMMERLARLEKLQIVNCVSLEEIFELEAIVTTQSIVTETVTKFMFPRVTYLRFDKLPNLKSFYSRKHAIEWPSLKTINVSDCPKVEIFVSDCLSIGETLGQSQVEISDVQQPLFWVNEVTFPILEELRLKQNDTMKGTWFEQLLPTVCFKNLKVIELSCILDKLTSLPYCFIKSLPDLEKLTLSDAPFCQIFQSDKVDDDERHALALSRLVELKLSKLPELIHLWNEPFRQTSILCNLNILEVLDCDKLKTLVPCWISFRNLITLKVSGCDGFIHLIACSVAKSLVLLREMSISDCKIIQKIIACECDDKEGGIIFSQLKHLELSNLPSLSSFCLGDHNFEFPALTKVIVKKWPKMENFIFERECHVIQRSYAGDLSTERLTEVQLTSDREEKGRCEGDLKTTVKQLFREKSTFPRLEELEMHYINVRIRRILLSQLLETSSCISNLTRLIIERCDKLELLLSPSIVGCLVQLKYFEIRNCRCLREIISKQEMEIEEDEQKIRICFPRLASLKMKDLPNLVEFCSENCTVEFPLLKVLEIQACPELHELISSEPKMQALFNQKVAFPSLERMTLSNIRNVKMIFRNELLEGSFCKLEEMTVEDCDELLIVFPSNITFRVFQNLKKLGVRSCDSLEVIFEVGEETSVVESQLRDLIIVSALRLKQIWSRDPQGILSFQSLSRVEVLRCESLKTVFPASIAKNLPQLENLSIGRCGVEEIVWEGEGEELNLEEQSLPLTFKFPRLSSIRLRLLEQLKCFYGSWGELKHIVVLEWPLLKSLDIDFSTLQKIGVSQRQQMNEEAQSLSHPFSFLQQVIPKLEELCLSDMNDVECGSLLQRFRSLESLQLYECDFKDVCVVDVGTLSTITMLELRRCENLKQLGLNFGFSSSCFQNLTTLIVCRCERMINLVTASVAQNLVHLITMKIQSCIGMTEIVANEGDEDRSTSIIFTKLKKLDLFCLQSLTSFCSGSYTFEFPSLEELIVIGCPSLKLFCHGVLSTPFLHIVTEWRYDGDKDYLVADKKQWTGDLSTTIQQMYAKKVGYGGLRILKLSDKFHELMQIWTGRNPQQYLNFMPLKMIELCGCNSLKYGFTSSIVLSLKKLERLDVKECINMEQVIWDECHEAEEITYDDGIFFMLNYVNIVSCANLRSFYLGSGALQFSKLHTINIFDCPKMMRFTLCEEKISDTNNECNDGDGTEKKLHQEDLNIAPFFNEEVVLPKLKELKINGIRDCKKMWSEHLSMNSFCKLKNIEIESCAMLLNIFPFNMMERLARLEKLQIVNCVSVEEIIESQTTIATQSILADTMIKFMFPRVTYIRFDKLLNMKSFYSRNHVTEWPSLKTMEVTECSKVEIFALKCHDFEGTLRQSQSDISNIQPPLFWVNEVTFPILEELRLNQNDPMKGTWLEQVPPTGCFGKLKVVELPCIPDKLTVVSYCFIKSLPDLEKLTLRDAPFCHIFQYDERHASTLSRLVELRLSKLQKLTNLWKEQFQPTSFICNLNILEVMECGKLEILVPCWISLRNLTRLKVSQCDGVINLIACSVARSLVLLREMSISDCKMIEEIIACECDDKEGSIIFSQLKHLELNNLPSLSSFCLRDHSLEFPALTKVVVIECPTMENFCIGDLNTPELKKVWLMADEGRWQDDLKTTVKQMFGDMVSWKAAAVECRDVSPIPNRNSLLLDNWSGLKRTNNSCIGEL